MRVGRTLLYFGAAASTYALYVQVPYLVKYFGAPLNPYGEEYLAGVLLIGLISAVVWIPTFGFALIRAQRYVTERRHSVLPILLSGLVGVLSVVSVVLSFAT